MDVTIVIATCGDPSWIDLAVSRALPSALAQRVPVVLNHGEALHTARNDAARACSTEWLCFLDADDALAPGYINAMAQASGDLRAPAVSWVSEHSETTPRTLADRDIEVMNPCVIGTLIRRDLFLDLGGFRDWPAWEDFCLFLRASRAGASIEHVPDAVYRAWVRPGSRNQSVRDPRALMRRIKEAA